MTIKRLLILGMATIVAALTMAALPSVESADPPAVDLCEDPYGFELHQIVASGHPIPPVEADCDGLAKVHTWQAAGTPNPIAWCTWRLAEWFPYYDYIASRMIHYGDAHVYQCRAYDDYWPVGHQYRIICFQQVEWYGWGNLDWWYPGWTGPGCPV